MAIKELDLPLTGAFTSESPLPSVLPQKEQLSYPIPVYTLHPDTERENYRAASIISKHILNGDIVVGDFLTTYGMMFSSKGREKVRLAKGEAENKPVSVVANLEDSIQWIDMSQVHPDFRDVREIRKLGNMLTNVGFLRFPANTEGKSLSAYAIDKGQLQVLFKDRGDIVLEELKHYGMPAYLVTSLNPHGELERYQPHLAYQFAQDINAMAFVLQTPHFEQALLAKTQDAYIDSRKKRGSVPIIQLPRNSDVNPYTGAPILTISRAANTHPYSVERVLKEVFPNAAVRYNPDKPEPKGRPQYSLPSEARGNLKTILYQASFPLEK